MSSLASLANVHDTPVHCLYKGVPFYGRASVKMSPTVQSTRIVTDAWGALGARKGDVGLTVDLEPAGEWESAAYALLHPYTTLARGTPLGVTWLRCTEANINTTSNRLTITSHGLSNADIVYLGTTGVFPAVTSTALAAGTAYYAKSIDADTIELYREVGLSTIVDFTDDGTGSLILVRDNPLDLYLINYGQKLRLHNAALVGIPDLQAGAASTPFGTARFEAFVRSGYVPSTANSYYTFSEEAWSDTAFDPASILTQPLTVAWGSSAPWSDLDLAEQAKVSFSLKTTELRSDRHGVVGRKLDDIEISAMLKVRGVNAYQALSQLAMESARGATRSLGVLNLSGTNFYFRGYASDVQEMPHEFGGGADLHGDFKLTLLRTITTGAPDARYFVGTGAPA